MSTVLKKIQNQINNNPIILYMKGSPKSPKCGFSARASEIISTFVKNFAYVDVLENTDIRRELPKFSNWPTFPQLWVNGKFIGGCDIIVDMYYKGELNTLLKNAMTNKNNIHIK